MMTGKSVKDIDRYQAVLNSLLSLEENKFCADCESKGPRWASWNLGIFICIRCAGIHRNLGVHISKVKSVNLDQWTQEQIQCVQEMGNAKARRLYEAFLPECFQRPETDQSAEIFIRDKYDRKKYMDKVIDIQMLRKEKSCDNIPKEPVVFEKMKLKKEVSPRTQSPSVTDLLGLDAPSPSPAVSNGAASRSGDKGSPALDLFNTLPASSSASAIHNTPVSSSMPRVAASVPDNLSLFLDPAAKAEEGPVKKLSKDSILSLYASAPSVHAGLYMNQMGYPTHPYGSYHSLAQAAGGGMGGTMMASQMAMMGQPQQQSGMVGAQQSGMMGVPQNCMMGQQSGIMGGQAGAGGSPYMSGMVQGVMGQQQQNGMMGVQQNSMLGQQQNGLIGQQQQQQQGMLGQQQLGGLSGLHHQQGYNGVQHAQQLQWNISQVSQHMSGMNFYGTNGMNGYSGQHMGAPTTQNPTQMAAQVWK